MKPFHVSGKRKTAIARATIKEGTGRININNMEIPAFSPEKMLAMKIMEPIILAGETAKKFDIEVNVYGGGINGRAEAARLAIAKALSAVSPALKDEFMRYDRHLLVADSRQREVRKPNTHGNARGKVQKSYR
jgi:small subunit ribosomal protein S9